MDRALLNHYWTVAENIKHCITVQQYSKLTNYSKTHVYKLLRVGKVKGIKIKGRWLVLPSTKQKKIV